MTSSRYIAHDVLLYRDIRVQNLKKSLTFIKRQSSEGGVEQLLFRSSHQNCSIKELFLQILQYSQENTCVGVSFNNVADRQTYNAPKKRLQHRCFTLNLAKSLRAPTL